MSDSAPKRRVKFETPGVYRIEVQGMLDASWSDRLAGMRIIPAGGQTHPPVTCLVGHLRDQAQLSGVLNTLYDLHLPILLVQYIPPNGGGNQRADKNNQQYSS
jgi:hypothetical protein